MSLAGCAEGHPGEGTAETPGGRGLDSGLTGGALLGKEGSKALTHAQTHPSWALLSPLSQPLPLIYFLGHPPNKPSAPQLLIAEPVLGKPTRKAPAPHRLARVLGPDLCLEVGDR